MRVRPDAHFGPPCFSFGLSLVFFGCSFQLRFALSLRLVLGRVCALKLGLSRRVLRDRPVNRKGSPDALFWKYFSYFWTALKRGAAESRSGVLGLFYVLSGFIRDHFRRS